MGVFPPVLNGSLMEIALSVAFFLERLTKVVGMFISRITYPDVRMIGWHRFTNRLTFQIAD